MDDQVLAILRSGNFTVICWDNDQYSFYEGKQTAHTVQEEGVNGRLEPFIEFDQGESDGYLPSAVALLIQALGGEGDSI